MEEVCQWATANGIAYSDHPIEESPIFDIQIGTSKSILRWAYEKAPSVAEQEYDKALAENAPESVLSELRAHWGTYCITNILKELVFIPFFRDLNARLGASK